MESSSVAACVIRHAGKSDVILCVHIFLWYGKIFRKNSNEIEWNDAFFLRLSTYTSTILFIRCLELRFNRMEKFGHVMNAEAPQSVSQMEPEICSCAREELPVGSLLFTIFPLLLLLLYARKCGFYRFFKHQWRHSLAVYTAVDETNHNRKLEKFRRRGRRTCGSA